MTDDIVTRLRHWANGAAEQEVQDVADGLNCAADEIERLRRNTGCARKQRSTQFCAEALDAQREVERLREQLRLANIDNFDTTAEVETLRAERDEANANAKLYRDERDAARAEATFLRPSVCLGAQTASEYAEARGWDCFKEDGK
jgi:uncharacterized coiled-coil DUF342 family protein